MSWQKRKKKHTEKTTQNDRKQQMQMGWIL